MLLKQYLTKFMDSFDPIVSLAKRRGFIFQSSEIYGGLSSCYDYGPLGVELKNNVKKMWWQNMVQERDDVVGIDGTNARAVKLSMSANMGTSCALLDEGSVSCWGASRIGDGTTSDQYLPKTVMISEGVALDNVVDIHRGPYHGCALKNDGGLYCWGRNFEYQLGIQNSSTFNYATLSGLGGYSE